MKVYVLTESERIALLKQLELTKFTAPKSQFISEGMTAEQIAEVIHKSFHFVVTQAFS